MQSETAEIIALQAFSYIASDDDIFRHFFLECGAEESDIKSRLRETDFQVAILDFLAQRDEWVTQFCAKIGVASTAIMEARQCLAPQTE